MTSKTLGFNSKKKIRTLRKIEKRTIISLATLLKKMQKMREPA
jgi:hypothetical protein